MLFHFRNSDLQECGYARQHAVSKMLAMNTSHAQSSAKPLGAQARFEQALDAGRFEIQRCRACERHIFHPRQLCPHCGSNSLEWVAPSGLGHVYATTTVRLSPEHPYDVSLVELDEGVRLMTRVRNLEPGAIKIGSRVRMAIVHENGKSRIECDALEADR